MGAYLSGTYLDAWDMREERLWTLGVIQCSVTHSPTRSPHCQTTAVKQVAGTVPELGGFVHDLNSGMIGVLGQCLANMRLC